MISKNKNNVDEENNVFYKEILKKEYVKKISEKTDSNLELVKRLIRSYLIEDNKTDKFKKK